MFITIWFGLFLVDLTKFVALAQPNYEYTVRLAYVSDP